jgi:hypothetical protein
VCDEMDKYSGVTECSTCLICNGTGKVSGNAIPYDEGSYVTIVCTDCKGTGQDEERLSNGALISWAIRCIQGHYNVGRMANSTLRVKA